MVARYSRYLISAALMVLAGLAVALVYAPGTTGGFIFDDISNIVKVPAIRLDHLSWVHLVEASRAGITGVTGRPLAVVSFALNYLFGGGLVPASFKWVNIVIHCINGALVFFLVYPILKETTGAIKTHPSRRTIRCQYIAAACAILWVLHPLHVSSVLYVVQRMNLLAATFSLAAMMVYMYLRARPTDSFYAVLVRLALFAICLVLGLLAKENAALVMLYVVLIECFVFGFRRRARTDTFVLFCIVGAGAILPGLIALVYTALAPGWILDGYTARDFTLPERLLTQARLLWVYVGWILLPDINQYSFHHDDIVLSKSLLSPATTLWSLLALLGAFVLLVWRWRSWGLVAFGIAFFFAGHLMESTVLPLELVFEHRNYLPSLGLMLAAVIFVQQQWQRYAAGSTFPALGILALGLVVVLGFMTAVRTDKWGEPLYSAALDVRNHPDSSRAHHYYAALLSANADKVENYELINHHFAEESRIDKWGIGGYYGQMFLNVDTQNIMDTRSIEDMIARVAQAKPRAETIHFIDHSMSKCLSVQCEPYFESKNLLGLIDAALANPYVVGENRLHFRTLRARYLIAYARDYDEASRELHEIIALDPKHLVANLYLLEILMAGKPGSEKMRILEEFSMSALARANPTMLAKIRKIAER